MKNKEVKFRLSTELYNMLLFKASASNKNVSDYLRTSIHDSNVRMNESKDISRLIGSVNKVGNNINQIAHNLNIANNSNKLDDINYNNILDKLTIIEYQLKELLKSV